MSYWNIMNELETRLIKIKVLASAGTFNGLQDLDGIKERSTYFWTIEDLAEEAYKLFEEYREEERKHAKQVEE